MEFKTETLPKSDEWKDAAILTVDDEPLIGRTIEAYLKHYGFANIEHLIHPEAAVETIRKTRPDLVLLDIYMPGVSGIDILTEVKQCPELKHTIVVMLSAADMESKYQALELGASDFINKPINPHELAVRVRHALMLHQQTK